MGCGGLLRSSDPCLSRHALSVGRGAALPHSLEPILRRLHRAVVTAVGAVVDLVYVPVRTRCSGLGGAAWIHLLLKLL